MTLQIDDSAKVELRQSTPLDVELEPGSHVFVARGKGFATAKTVIETKEKSPVVVAITPLHREGPQV